MEDFWTDLVKWVNKANTSGFVSDANKGILVEGRSGEEVVGKLRNYQVSEGRLNLKWVDKRSCPASSLDAIIINVALGNAYWRMLGETCHGWSSGLRALKLWRPASRSLRFS